MLKTISLTFPISTQNGNLQRRLAFPHGGKRRDSPIGVRFCRRLYSSENAFMPKTCSHVISFFTQNANAQHGLRFPGFSISNTHSTLPLYFRPIDGDVTPIGSRFTRRSYISDHAILLKGSKPTIPIFGPEGEHRTRPGLSRYRDSTYHPVSLPPLFSPWLRRWTEIDTSLPLGDHNDQGNL